ncbi:MAG: alpha/beta fold hydrolase [Planctomycetota bacterium]
MLRRPTTSLKLLRPAFLVLFIAACSVARVHSGGSAADPLPLAAIFDQDRPIDGNRPSDITISADGRFATYRWTPPPPPESSPASAPARARAKLWAVATGGGSAVDLSSINNPVWLAEGSRLLYTKDKTLQIWEAGTPLASSKVYYTFGDEVQDVRTSADARRAIVTSGKQQFEIRLDDDAPVARAIIIPETHNLSRSYFTTPGLLHLLTEKNDTESRPAESRPESRAGNESRSASRSTATRRAQKYQFFHELSNGKVLATSNFEPPAGFELEQTVPDAFGQYVILTFSETRSPSRSGMVPDYLTTKVTTRPARGGNTSDGQTRQCLRILHIGDNNFASEPIFEEAKRVRFEIVASRDGRAACRFIMAVNGEDRSKRELYRLAVKTGLRLDPPGGLDIFEILSVPGPTGGNERILSGVGSPVILSESGGYGGQLFTLENPTGTPQSFSPSDVDVSWCAWGETKNNETQRVTIALVTKPDAPHERELWRMFRNGEPHAPLPTNGMFISNPALSRDGSRIAFMGSRLGESEDIYSMPADGSAPPKRLTFTAPSQSQIPGPEVPLRVINYPSADGTTVWAFCYEPPPGVARNGAAVIFLHGAGYLQQVRASIGHPNYAVNHHFHRRLAANGFVVLAPDFRGSAGYGRKFRTDVYQNLGIPDSADVVAAKRWLAENCNVHDNRVGLYGGSYGGFLTLMCLMLYPKEFASGAALRSVTDWRTYTPEYTRPLLGGGPDEVPHVYARTSPMDYAAKLERPLLLLHGMMDDNVFVQDTIRLVEQLQKLGKTEWFELMLYPSQNHGFTQAHAWVDEYLRIERFFEKHLLTTDP